MAARAAMGRAVLAAGGTMIGLGLATMGVATVSMTVARVAMAQSRKKHLVTCRACHGVKKLPCDVCQGERLLRYHPSPDAQLTPKQQWSVCPMCEGAGEQTCLNCMGDGDEVPVVIQQP